MNGSLDGGMYAAVMTGALAVLFGFFSRRGQGGSGRSWKRAALLLAAIATPMVLLLASGSGF